MSAFAENIDLSSTNQTVTASGSGTIDNGGQSLSINPGMQITPAQAIALSQVLAGGQTIMLNGDGAAVGGTLNLNSIQTITNLVIPTGVTAIHDFGSLASLNIAGSINNSGNIYAVSSDAGFPNAILNIGNLMNTGLISSILPDGGLSGYSNLMPSLSLSINVMNTLMNTGIISSSGDLSIAASSIVNSGSITAMSNLAMSAATIANMGNMMSQTGNLSIATSTLTNTGIFEATLGNLVIRDLLADGLKIDNTSGILRAGNDIIAELISSQSNQSLLHSIGGELNAGNNIVFNAGPGNIQLTGGDYFSSQLILNALNGSVLADVGQIQGDLKINAAVAHVYANTDNLVLGDNCITGDPTYFNNGNIVINGAITANEDLAIIATGNITSTAGATGITARGHNVTLIAGASATCTGCTTSTGAPTGANSIGAGNFANVNFGSGNGGRIDINNAGFTGINTSGNSAGQAGGNVTLAAYSGATQGYVRLVSTSTISTGGNGSGADGNVTIYAGGLNGNNGIAVGNVSTNSGGTGTSGSITMTTAQPTGTPSFSNTGVQTGTIGTGTMNSSARIITGNLSSNGGDINLHGGARVQTGSIVTPGGTANITSDTATIAVTYPTSATLGDTSTGTTLNLSSTGTATITSTAGDLTLQDGAVTMTGGGNLNLTANSGTIDFRPAILTNGTPLSNDQGGILVQANTINLGASGTLNISSNGDLLNPYGFSVGVRFDAPNAGGGGIIFPNGSLTMNFTGTTGSGVEFDSFRTTDSFPGLNTSNLTINSAGDIHFAGEVVNQNGGSINATVPANTAYYTFQIDSVVNTPVAFSNISVTNGALSLISAGRITLNGNFTVGGTPYQNGGVIFVESGFDYSYGVSPPTYDNTQVGIVVSPGALLSANPGYVILSVVNVQTSPPLNPAVPVISIGAGAQVLGTGNFVNGSSGTQTGGGVQITVNTPLGLPTSLVNGLEAQRPTYYISQEQGSILYIDQSGSGTLVTESPSITNYVPGGVMLTANNDGLVTYANGGSPSTNLLSGSGTVQADGGLVIVGGTTYDNEIVIDGTVTGTLPAALTPPPPPPPPIPVPPPPPPIIPVVPPGDGGGTGAPPTSGTVIPLDALPAIPVAVPLPQQQTTINQTQTIQIIGNVDARYQVASSCAVFSILPAKKLSEDKFAKYRGDAPVIMTFAGTTLKAEEPNENDLKNGIMNLTIQEGRVLVIGGTFNLIVRNKFGTKIATIPPKSTVVVEVKGNTFSLGNLSEDLANNNASPVKAPTLAIATPNGAYAKEVSVAPGTNEIASDDDEELIPTDGLGDTTVTAKLTVADSNVTMRKSSIINKQKYMSRGDRITCNMIDNDSIDKDLQRMRAKLKELKILAEEPGQNKQIKTQSGPDKQLKTENNSDNSHLISAVVLTPAGMEYNDNHFQPVAYHAPLISPDSELSNALSTKSLNGGLIKALAGTEYSVNSDGTVLLTSGDLLIDASSKPQKVTVGKSTIDVGSGAIALISHDQSQTEVCNLWESGTRAVKVHTAGSTLPLASGQEALLIGKKASVSDALLKLNYGRRGNKVTDLSDGSSALTGEVSLHSVLYVNKLLHKLATSSAKSDQQITDKVVKMTAILTIVTARRGRFEFVSR
ncbi:MAG: hypothetical protein K2W82_14465 [Candidatus Obscuribacterales bacterium]|nr:hypothetical protein [Candidatus Obscuribacterales bacterium]